MPPELCAIKLRNSSLRALEGENLVPGHHRSVRTNAETYQSEVDTWTVDKSHTFSLEECS